MKLLLTPELFILQDSSQSKIASQDEEKEENRESFKKDDLECNIKHMNRTKRFIDTPEFHLLNSQTNQDDLNIQQQLNQKQEINQSLPLEPNIRIVEKNGKIIYDKRLVTKRKPRREVIQSDIRCVNLNKEKFGGSFGITIRGGLEFNKPLIISNIQRSSAADKCRSLFLGDLIVELNGHQTYPIRLTHEQAMKLIKSGGNKLHLTVKHLTMYNRMISRCWQRHINMNWLNNNESKVDEEWLAHQTGQNKSTVNSSINSSLNSAQIKDDKSSFQENFIQPTTIASNENQDHLIKNKALSSCERSNFSNLTVTITTEDKTDSQTPSPLNDEGVYTGLSNDALSSSSDATSCFSSDYIQSSSQNSNQQTNLNHNRNNNHTHHCNKTSSLSKHEFNFANYKQMNYNESLIENRINCLSTDCSSLDCKNRKNNNCCTKCIVNKNHQNLNYLNHVNELKNNNDLKQWHAIDCRNLISQEDSLHLEPVDQDFNFNKENSLNFQNFSFRSTDCADSLQTIKHSPDCKKVYNSSLDNIETLEHLQRTIANNGNQHRITNSEKISNECCSCRSSSTAKTSSSNRSSNNLVDIVSVNLINCYFTKYINNTDNVRRNGMEVRWFDLHNQKLKKTKQKSPVVEVNSAIISFNDNELAQQFQNKINDYLSKLNESYMFTFNRGLSPEKRILFMGWISLALPKAKDLSLESIKNQQAANSLDYNWQPKYMIIKGGELSLFDYVPDFLLDKIQYANDTLMEFSELSNLLINKNGNLACTITMMNKLNQNKTKNTQQNGRQATRSKSFSIRGQDSSINLEKYRSNNNGDKLILTEANNSLNKKAGNRLACSLNRNLSLKTAKENRYSNSNRLSANSKLQRTTNLHCTLPRNQVHLAGDHQASANQQFTLDRKQNLKRATAASNLFTPNEYLLTQTNDDGMVNQQTEFKYQNKPIIFKAYQSVLRELKENEQLDRRENCLLALTTQADNSIDLANTFRKQSTINHSTGEYDKSSWLDSDQVGKNLSGRNSLDYLNSENRSRSSKSSPSMVAYLAVEHSDNISQILKSWNVATMHSVIALSVSRLI